MSTLLEIVPYLFLIAFSVIGIIEYVKAFVLAVKSKQVGIGIILSPIISTGVAFIGAPIIFGGEIVGTISYIYFTGALAVLTLASVQLFYELIVQTMKAFITRLANGPARSNPGA